MPQAASMEARLSGVEQAGEGSPWDRGVAGRRASSPSAAEKESRVATPVKPPVVAVSGGCIDACDVCITQNAKPSGRRHSDSGEAEEGVPILKIRDESF